MNLAHQEYLIFKSVNDYAATMNNRMFTAKEADKRKNEYENHVKQLISFTEYMKFNLKSKDEDIEVLQSNIEDLQKENAEQENEISGLECDLNRYQREIDVLEDKVNDLEDQLKEKENNDD